MSVHEFQRKSPQKALWAAVVFASLAALVLIVVNLPYRYSEFAGQWLTQSAAELQWLGSGNSRQPIYAGVPLRFYEKWESPDGPSSVLWSTKNLALDALMACAVVALVFCLTRLRYRLVDTTSVSDRKCLFLDALTAAVLVATLSLFASSLYRETQLHRRLATHPSLNGSCYLSCRVPAILKNKVPSFTSKFLSRIRVVNSRNSSATFLSDIVRLKSLHGLLAEGSAIEVSHLKTLSTLPQFTSLHLNSIQLTEEHASWIGNISQLEDLNLSNTNLDASLLRHFDKLEHLQTVHLGRTPLRLSDLGTPLWKESVVNLYLPRRIKGPPDHVRIDQWPSLQSLSITNPSVLISPETIRIEITNCPVFRRLAIDRVQKHDLIARNLPKFQHISEDIDELSLFGTSLDGLPRETCFGVVNLENTPSLQDLGVYAKTLESIRIVNAPSLNLLTISNDRLVDRDGTYFPTNERVSIQRIVDDIGNCEGPSCLCFDQLDFQQVDIKPLTKNHHVRELRFLQSQIDFSQIQELAALTRLRSIIAESCEATSDDIAWMLETFPELETLDLDIGGVDELALTSQPTLAMFASRPLKRVKRILLQDVPELEMDIHVACPIDELLVHDAPQLTGLGLASPWPPRAKLSGLRGLRWFAAGGERVDDSVFEPVLYCRSLDRLMLAYPSISKESLKNIGGFLELTSLVLPGADIDDSVTSSFRKLRMLREANFDDCKIGTPTIQWLHGIESLRRLSINYVKLPPAAWLILSRMKQLNELEAAGANFSDDVFADLMLELRLEHLNIDGQKLSNTKFECLKQNNSLRLLNVSRCGLSRDQIQQLLNANKSLLVYCEETDTLTATAAESSADPQTPDSLGGRVVSRERYLQIRLLLANYGVPQDSMLRRSYFASAANLNLEQALFGWFDSSQFRTPTNLIESN